MKTCLTPFTFHSSLLSTVCFRSGTFLCLLSLLWSLNLQAQDITLHRGKQTKVIKAGTFVEVVLKSPGDSDCDVCQYNHFAGKLIAYQNHEVILEVRRGGEVFSEDGKIVRYATSQFSKAYPHQPHHISANDIIAFIPRGKKKLKYSTTGETMGTVLAMLGVGHLVSSPFGRENGVLLLGLGLGEIVVGATLGIAFQPKAYPTHADYLAPAKQFEPLWELR